MKVGTDGVLLGAWAGVENAKTILDVGTGSGLIALMLAQRSHAAIDAIDINPEAYEQAVGNIRESVFSQRIQVYLSSLNEYTGNTTNRYDLIVSNPPYFVQSLRSPDNQRTVARHTDSLSLESLLTDSSRLLSPGGRIALILPADREDELNTLVENLSLSFLKKTYVIPIPGAPPKRILAEMTNTVPVKPSRCDDLLIEINRHQYSPEYKALTEAFYLGKSVKSCGGDTQEK